jgi:alpha-galactosidase
MTEIVARRIAKNIALDAAHPDSAWQTAAPIEFCSDWQGLHPDSDLLTRVLALWSPDRIFLRFECHYRDLHVFDDSDPSGRRDHLWDRDVAEAFLQPKKSSEKTYKEFEVSPNGMWIDLDISPTGDSDLHSGLQRSVTINRESKLWFAELSLPFKSLTDKFDPQKIWGANFYRVEGKQEPRKYLAWQPTHTPEPNFHVPEAFGALGFE